MENKSNNRFTLKIAGILSIASFIIFLSLTSLSIYLTPWFNWTNNWLSELAGVGGATPPWSAYGLPSILFNSALIISGILAFIFAVIVIKNKLYKNGFQKLIVVLIGLDMIAMISCGIFPITFGKIHTYCAVAYLGLIPIIFILVGLEIKRLYGNKWFWANNSFCCGMFFSFGLFYFTPNLSGLDRAIAEIILIFAIYLIILAMCKNFLFKNFKLKYLKPSISLPHVLYNKKLFRLPTSER